MERACAGGPSRRRRVLALLVARVRKMKLLGLLLELLLCLEFVQFVDIPTGEWED